MVKSVLSQEEMLDIDVPVSRIILSLHRCWEACKNAVSELCRSKTAIIGALMLLVLLGLCLLTPYIARYDHIKQNYREMLQTPSAKHYFGTDRYGRDIWARILWGAGVCWPSVCWQSWWVSWWVSLWARCRDTMASGLTRSRCAWWMPGSPSRAF